MHLFGHLFARVRRCPLEDFRIVVIKPFNPAITIERLDARAYPAAEIAVAVGVNLDFWLNGQWA